MVQNVKVYCPAQGVKHFRHCGISRRRLQTYRWTPQSVIKRRLCIKFIDKFAETRDNRSEMKLSGIMHTPANYNSNIQ